MYDLLIIGGGHAGVEAAYSSSGYELKILLITLSIRSIGRMSCNPAIGGVGKGHLVKEIDMLGGLMGKTADISGIYFKILNSSKGAAVQAIRSQNDMNIYKLNILNRLKEKKNLDILEDEVIKIITKSNKILGVETSLNGFIQAKRIILTVGTFLDGNLHIGNNTISGGRWGESTTSKLKLSLNNIGVNLQKFKTGTCPRLDGKSINYNVLDKEYSDLNLNLFSHKNYLFDKRQVTCFITRTTKYTHKIILDAIKDGEAPLFNGQVEASGPRYCPSIEDKIIKFINKDSHLIFLEPEGIGTREVYPSGIATSLPPKIQYRFLKTIPGFEKVKIIRWGYAVEYFYINKTQMKYTLETKKIKGLYCAGQINGTTGYEEAAIQGLIAGINASCSILNKAELILSRNRTYTGVLIDDVIGSGVIEPYRLFTARAENRLFIRQDNIVERLSQIGFRGELLALKSYIYLDRLDFFFKSKLFFFEQYKLIYIYKKNLSYIKKKSLFDLKKIKLFYIIMKMGYFVNVFIQSRWAIEKVYRGYINKLKQSEKSKINIETILIPHFFKEYRIDGISNEIFEKINTVQPNNIEQMRKIGGITPGAIALFVLKIKRNKKKK